jgi:hypothetical protein
MKALLAIFALLGILGIGGLAVMMKALSQEEDINPDKIIAELNEEEAKLKAAPDGPDKAEGLRMLEAGKGMIGLARTTSYSFAGAAAAAPAKE